MKLFDDDSIGEEMKKIKNNVDKNLDQLNKLDERIQTFVGTNDEEEIDVKNHKTEILEASNIDRDEYSFLMSKRKYNKAEHIDKLKIEKFEIINDYGIDRLDMSFLNLFYGKKTILVQYD